ncbi:MAG TPA: hypothetical protein DCR48_12290 [Flavobacteriales bacterium]|jgi:hypothetical protein|nr:hypothetical protein [bacterium]HAQ71746.1 hypothetical protein [Flavobacteriales bacterium]
MDILKTNIVKEKANEFPQYLAKPAQETLLTKGVFILNDLSRFTKSEIKALKGIGPEAFAKIQSDLWDEGISFKKEKH